MNYPKGAIISELMYKALPLEKRASFLPFDEGWYINRKYYRRES